MLNTQPRTIKFKYYKMLKTKFNETINQFLRNMEDVKLTTINVKNSSLPVYINQKKKL